MSLKSSILSCAKKALKEKNAFHLFLPKIDSTVDRGCKFLFHYYDSSLLRYVNVIPTKRSGSPLIPPFDPGLHVCDLTKGANHHLIINKFMQCEGHVVISSRDKNEKQGSKLNMQDFSAFEQVFNSFNNEGMLYYNSGIKSGCSQLHKHLQYTPIKEHPILDAMVEDRIPIQYHVLDVSKITAENMIEVYKEFLQMAKTDSPHDSYNFIICQGKAYYIPRRKCQHKSGIVINSFAMTGNLSIFDWCDPLTKKKPLSILEDVCFPTVK